MNDESVIKKKNKFIIPVIIVILILGIVIGYFIIKYKPNNVTCTDCEPQSDDITEDFIKNLYGTLGTEFFSNYGERDFVVSEADDLILASYVYSLINEKDYETYNDLKSEDSDGIGIKKDLFEEYSQKSIGKSINVNTIYPNINNSCDKLEYNDSYKAYVRVFELGCGGEGDLSQELEYMSFKKNKDAITITEKGTYTDYDGINHTIYYEYSLLNQNGNYIIEKRTIKK